MDLEFTKSDQEFREEVRQFIAITSLNPMPADKI